MFTNNMVNFMKGAALDGGSSSYVQITDCNGRSVSTNIANILCGFLYYMDTARCRTQPTSYASSILNSYPGVYFGTGSTPANKADYKLENLLTSGLSITDGTRQYIDEGNGVHSYYVTFAVKNTTEAEINIYEIGLFSPIPASSKYYCTLMERTVLTEPITIAPGATKLVTYKITFNQTLNVE